MTTTEVQDSNAAKMQQAILHRSATDRAFRSKLIASPRAAIAEFVGVSEDRIIDENIVFIENKAGATVLLPDFIEEGALSESELEQVAGGTITTLVVIALLGANGVVWSRVAGQAYEIYNS